jgi:F-box and WD-40 domain protein CDC4
MVTHHQMMQFADECIETKTITTTTTTKRSYPPLFLRQPRDVHSLDSKEYPLASRPTPPELRRLTYDLYEHDLSRWEDDGDTDAQVSRPLARPLRVLLVLVSNMGYFADSTFSKRRLRR